MALTQDEFLAQLAQFVVITWSVIGGALGLLCWTAPAFVLIFVLGRIKQLRDPLWDSRPLSTTGNAFHLFFAVLFGITLPAFYFLSVRTRHAIGPWYLGPDTNSGFTITLGILCMGWLLTRVLQAARRFDRIRFDAWPADVIMAFISTGLCLWFHFGTVASNITAPMEHLAMVNMDTRFFAHWYPRLVYPQACFGAATAVYAFALVEAILAHRRGESSGHPWGGVIVSVVLIGILFSPFILSIPRTSHAQAMALLDRNRDEIVEVAEAAELDPALLAGIIYIAHTRDRPRITGDAIESFGLRVWAFDLQSGIMGEMGTSMLNPSVGLCQIRPTTAMQTLSMVGSLPALQVLAQGEGISVKINARPWAPYNVIGPYVHLTSRFQQIHGSRLGGAQGFPPTMSPLVQRIAETRLNLEAYLPGPDSLRYAAVMLAILRAQWEADGHPIDDRPEILATLYNIGYERSHPHGEPQANDFGRRVAAFMETEECRALFDDGGGQ